jgi:hypothetical protein
VSQTADAQFAREGLDDVKVHIRMQKEQRTLEQANRATVPRTLVDKGHHITHDVSFLSILFQKQKVARHVHVVEASQNSQS